jgi:chorismate mutase
VVASAAAAHAQAGGPILNPEQQRALLERVRANLFRDRELESQYTYLEKRRDVRVSKLGKVSLGDERTFEVYPSAEPGATYKRLIAVNGVPLPAAELARRDERHRNDLLGEQQRRAAEPPAARAARERRQAERLERQKREVDEAIAAFDMRVLDRVVLEGHARPLLVVQLTPRANARASSDLVKYAKKFAGKAWVDETSAQVVRVELTAIEDVTIGWGLVGRVHKGSVASFERRHVNGEVWLPWRARLSVRGRAALFRRFDFETVTEWWDYKKFSVATATSGAFVPK